jgi:glycosyltransferase involved in cell wall biosynthesis
MKLSVVIPCYNSEKSIINVIDETISTIKLRNNIEYEIILINDGSTDNTFSVIKNICKNNKNIIGIDLSKNFGQASAMLAGYKYTSGNFIVHSDDDGQTPINELWKLVDKIKEGYDIVFAQYHRKKNTLIQNIGTWVNIKTSEIFLGKPKGVHIGNFFCCRKFIIEEICKNNNPYPFIGGLFIKTTHNFGTVKTVHRKRHFGKSNYNIKKMLSLWINGLTAFSVAPLRFASIVGIFTSFSGFFYACYLIVQRFIHDTIPEGYTSIMSVILFVSGIIMLLLGIIGEYVGRIYLNINKVPQFIVREEINTK